MRPAVFALVTGLALGLATAAEVRAQTLPAEVRARALRATVALVDRRGPRAQGVVLAGSGRVLTALDPLREADELQVVYPDGRRDRVRPVAVDEPWGLALLEGSGGTWPEGLALAEREPRSREAVAWRRPGVAEISEGVLARRRSFVGREATLLRDAWELDPAPAPETVGGAVIHPREGTVLGVIVPPGRNEITGAEITFAVPLPVVRALVARAGASSRPWVGLTFAEIIAGQGDVSAPMGGLRVRAVEPDGPGARAGLRGGAGGDVVVGVDGRPVHTIHGFGECIANLGPGDTITLQVLRRGATVDLPLTLGTRPQAAAPVITPSRPPPEPAPRAPRPPRPGRDAGPR